MSLEGNPRFATDDAYTSGTDDTLPNKIAPSTGRRAQGFDRDHPLAFPVLNHMLANHGEHLAAIIDQHAFQWTTEDAFEETDLAANDNTSSSPPLLYAAGERWLVKTPDGGTGVCFHSRAAGLGNQHGSDADSVRFVASTDSGAGADATILTDRTLNRIVAISSGYAARKTDDWGGTWSGAGTAFTGTGGVTCGGFFAGAWHALKTDVDGTQDIGSSSTLSGSWTNTDLGDPDPPSYRRFVASPDVAVFLPTASTALMQVPHNDGGGWTLETIAGITSATSTWRGAYNEHLDLFLFTNLAGQCYLSAGDDGLTWALGLTHLTAIYDVAASGRGWIISGVTEDFSGPATFPALWFVAYGADGTLTAKRMNWEGVAQSYPRYHLVKYRGRVIAARVMETGSRLEWWESGVHPSDVDANGL